MEIDLFRINHPVTGPQNNSVFSPKMTNVDYDAKLHLIVPL